MKNNIDKELPAVCGGNHLHGVLIAAIGGGISIILCIACIVKMILLK
jgi:hypothetical protein